MNNQDFRVGSIIKNYINQFAKIVSIKNNIYGLSKWGNIENAKKANVAQIHVNIFGINAAKAVIIYNEIESDNPLSDGEISQETISKMKVDALKALCEKEGLITDGKKSDLQERLIAHLGL